MLKSMILTFASFAMESINGNRILTFVLLTSKLEENAGVILQMKIFTLGDFVLNDLMRPR